MVARMKVAAVARVTVAAPAGAVGATPMVTGVPTPVRRTPVPPKRLQLNRVQIIPTVLARTKEEFRERLAKLLPVARVLQVDFEDGRFVPSTGVALHELPDLRQYPQHTFEAHLMVEHPGAYVQPCARHGFKRVIVHVETLTHGVFENLVWQCERHKLELFLAVKPETNVHKLLWYVDGQPLHDGRAKHVDGILFMGVHPGFNGAPYLSDTPDRIRALLRAASDAGLLEHVPVIQVDGGMTPMSIGGVIVAGARRVNSGSFISNAPDARLALAQLQGIADEVLARSECASRELHAARTKTSPMTSRRPMTNQSSAKRSSTKRSPMKRSSTSRRVNRPSSAKPHSPLRSQRKTTRPKGRKVRR